MNPKLIEIRKTYRNKGAGRTTRIVIDIGTQYQAHWWGSGECPNEPVVKYKQGDKDGCLYLSSFAQWAGSVAEETRPHKGEELAANR